MLAFIQRRWIFLSFALALIVCAGFDLYLGSSPMVAGGCIVYKGHLFVWYGDSNSLIIPAMRLGMPDGFDFGQWDFHVPMFGGFPALPLIKRAFLLRIPLWLPISAVLGWIIIGEVRWREKRALEKSAHTDILS